MQQYKNLVQRILKDGEWVRNERTGVDCLTVINADLEYNVGAGEFPMITLREVNPKIAFAELLAYLRGYTNAAQFRELGTKTWDANANLNKAWLANPNRTGEDDLGFIYGAVARNWPKTTGGTIDLVRKVYDNLRNGIDDRGETITFWNPGEFDRGCLRPCLHTHTFSLLNGTLHLISTQRSNDAPLGNVANMIQCYTLLALMTQITGHKPGIAYHKSINVHIYKDQIPMMEELVSRECLPSPQLWINPEIKSLEDLETWVTVSDFKVLNYESHPAMKIPFTV